MTAPLRTRFAPSPTGPLHLGHAYSALLAHDMARAAGGQFLLRIEDIDRARSRADWEDAIAEDLAWLGLRWDAPPMRQSDRLADYAAALDMLWSRGLLYQCTCTRRDIAEALSAPQETAPRELARRELVSQEPVSQVPDPQADGPDGPVYPGTCRPSAPPATPRTANPQPATPQPTNPRPGGALRLDMRRAMAAAGTLAWEEAGEGVPAGPCRRDRAAMVREVGDVVLARRDMGTSYHLSVVCDDAAQAITDVVRGADLAPATAIHVLLQRLLGLPTPRYRHHRLIRDEAGRRLAKRDDARAIRLYRAEGLTPADIRRRVGLPAAPGA